MNDYLEFKSLCHHGVKGQKWGVRRFQNEDGTLTSQGKQRLDKINKVGKEVKNITDAAQQAIPQKGSKRINKKDYSKMSDDELRKKVNRLQMERQYGDLTGDNKYVMSGREWAREALQTIGAIAAIGASAAMIYSTLKGVKK